MKIFPSYEPLEAMSSSMPGQYMMPLDKVEPTVPATTSDCSSSEATRVVYSRFEVIGKPKARGKADSVAHSVSSEALKCKLHHNSIRLLHICDEIIGFTLLI